MPTVWRQNCKHGQLVCSYAIQPCLHPCQIELIHSRSNTARTAAASKAPRVVSDPAAGSHSHARNYPFLLNRCNVCWPPTFLLTRSLQEAPTNITFHWCLGATPRDRHDARLTPGIAGAWARLLFRVWLLNKIFTYLQRYNSNLGVERDYTGDLTALFFFIRLVKAQA